MENVTHIINNQSFSHTLSLRVIHMFTYFIFPSFTLLYTREVPLTSI